MISSEDVLLFNKNTVKTVIKENSNDIKEISKVLGSKLEPLSIERKKNAEISTPFWLKQEMLDKIPSGFWKTPKKVFEPCCGKGGFILDIIDRFMKGMEKSIPNNEKRYKTIVEKCLYFSDINRTNIEICKIIIDPANKYDLNYNHGNTLELDIFKKWGFYKFDAIIGNPPYEYPSTNFRGTLWDKFVLKAIEQISKGGYICMVHPPGWRNIKGKYKGIQNNFKSMWMIYLEIHDIISGIKTFKAQTRYDWYVIQNVENTKKTTVKFEDGEILKLNLRKEEFIPNSQYAIVKKLYAKPEEKTFSLVHTNSYSHGQKHISKEKTSDYKYPCINYINSQNKLKLLYSCKKELFFDYPKIIWTRSYVKTIRCFLDIHGKYGLTDAGFGIVETKQNLKLIKQVFDSCKFKKFLQAITINRNIVNVYVLSKFRKNFWKDFL